MTLTGEGKLIRSCHNSERRAASCSAEPTRDFYFFLQCTAQKNAREAAKPSAQCDLNKLGY